LAYVSRVIDTELKLAGYLPAVRAAAWVAVDTEADSLHAYPEKLCLLQISTPAGDELVDPLSGIGLPPLFAALDQHELIFHAADYDLRLMRKHHAFVPHAIFDTMLAARLLGFKKFSLGDLVEAELGVKLEKGSQKADWARRPLTERMEIYARNDTHYLKPLSDKLRAALKEKGRLPWHRESCQRLIADSARLSAVDGDTVWRVKGSFGLSRPGLAVLRELWHWREKEALAANRPPFFILHHDTLVAMADAAASQSRFEHLLPRHLSPRRCDGLKHAVAAALALPPDQLPHPPKRERHRPTEAETRRFRELEKRRDKHAAELAIDPTLIAPRATLGELAKSWDAAAPDLMHWQRELLK
jgi:ribonuclease D